MSKRSLLEDSAFQKITNKTIFQSKWVTGVGYQVKGFRMYHLSIRNYILNIKLRNFLNYCEKLHLTTSKLFMYKHTCMQINTRVYTDTHKVPKLSWLDLRFFNLDDTQSVEICA